MSTITAYIYFIWYCFNILSTASFFLNFTITTKCMLFKVKGVIFAALTCLPAAAFSSISCTASLLTSVPLQTAHK